MISSHFLDVAEAVSALEATGSVPEPTGSLLIEGRWQFRYTTRRGTASPIQEEADLGVDEGAIGSPCSFMAHSPFVSRSCSESRRGSLATLSKSM
ncbi:probable plastid-lipid-associated protein 12, chloroplastic isoform X2 [Physcomitrium patens]|uniref:probable plastid-lipid-associated protein 12, chloroplastic isoform X2 n=1 Tax=Physcomitrium patens TaxID=3218 RepID=UPI003CCD8098